MFEEKKFLDQEGVKQLWSKISMEDYPNNETLIAVLNAIDQTKADKDEIPTLTSQLENDSNFVSEDYVRQNLQELKNEVILTTPQTLTEKQKNQVKENLGIDSISSGLTSITTEYIYTYDGDMNSNEWVLNGSGHKMYVRLGDIPEGTINVVGSHVSVINATNSILNVSFEVTEEHLTRSLSMYDGAMVAEAQQNGFIQILEPIGYYTDPVSALCICTKPGNYIVSFGGWLEWITFDKTGIYGYETRTWGGNEYCASYTFTATINQINGGSSSSSPIDYKGNEILAFCRGICIGDSVTEGTLDHSEGTMNKAGMSYPSILKRLTGIDIVNAGIAGATSGSWYETSLNSAVNWGDWVNNEWFWREPQGSSLDYSGFDFAIIHLGINDIGMMEEGTSITDLVSAFETNINNIVTKLRDNNNRIKIFIATIIPSYASNYNASYKALNEKIIEIANASSDIYLLDLNTLSNLTMHQAYNVWHPTALGYVKLAEEIKALISYTISQNLDDFKDIHLIGTDYVF